MAKRHSELSRLQRLKARKLAKSAAMLSLRHAKRVHYSQNITARWEGITHEMKAYKGEYPKYTDCSASVTWWIWNGLHHFTYDEDFDFADTVNGQEWRRGYTGTIINNGEKIPISRWKLRRGDAILYGDPYGGSGHVALYVGNGMVVSHGSEGGPYLLPWNYRPVVAVRRAI